MCYMAARAAIQRGARMCIVDIEALPEEGHVLGSIFLWVCVIANLAHCDDSLMTCPNHSAPTVTLERTPSGTESRDATDALLSCHPGVKMAAQVAVFSIAYGHLRFSLNVWTG